MQKRIRLQKMLIFSLAVIISILLVGLIAGRNDTVPVLIINSDQIDLTKTLAEQAELLVIEDMSKEEYDRFGGTIVTSLEEINGARLKFPLAVGSPVITSALTTTDTAGQFAANTPQFHTIFKMPEITGSLPPGIQAGDAVDIDLLIEKPGEPPTFIIGPLLQNIKVSGVEETTLYLMVSQREYEMLSVARRVGSFVVQLPGQKKVNQCNNISEEILAQKETEITNLANDEAFNKLNAEEKQAFLNELDEKYTFRLANAECFEESDKPTTLTSDLIIEQVENGKTLEEILDGQVENLPEEEEFNFGEETETTKETTNSNE